MHKLDKNIVLRFGLDPLIDAIRNNKAVVYVGAGASKAAGLPDWEAFLKQCLSQAKDSYNKNFENGNENSKGVFELAEKWLTNGDYSMSAELLQQEVGSTLSKFIWDTFGTKRTPSAIHKAIARIPFSLAITTNYDKLLEGAYNKNPNVFTWLDPQAIFSSIKHNRFAVVKTHGDVGNDPSVVLTKTHYRNLMHLNKAFNDEIMALFSLKTFLFIGSSLRDHDLLHLMDVARLTYGKNFGPHYAFLFKNEVDDAFIRYLRDSYSIRVIVSEAEREDMTESVCSFLKVLSGRASDRSSFPSEALTINSGLFCFNNVVHEKLRSILIQTGAERGLVAFIDRRDLPGLRYFLKEDIFEDKSQKVTSINSGSSLGSGNVKGALVFEKLLKACYYKGNAIQKHVYYPDLGVENKSEFETDITNWSFDFGEDACFDGTRSVLMTQLHSDGQLVGAIMIKSSMADAFTKGHLAALKASTVFLSATFKELELRNLPLLEINLRANAGEFQALMDNSNLLRGYDISYLFYEIDHRNGRLVAHYDATKVERVQNNVQNEPFMYDFSDGSLATHLLVNQQEVYYSNVDNGVAEGVVAEVGVKEFKIKGEIFATPIRVGNYNSFILVAWSRKERFMKPTDSLNKVRGAISRMAHLIANSTDRTRNNSLAGDNKAKTFIESVNEQLKPIDEKIKAKALNESSSGKSKKEESGYWGYEVLKDEENRIKLYTALMRVLTQPACNLGRVRLWLYDEASESFSCIYSITQPSATVKGKVKENAYTSVPATPAHNDYCRYTLNRFRENPHAMHQHVSMFSGADPNTSALDKDPEGKWIVGPIVSRTPKQKEAAIKLLGFISADNHFVNGEALKDRILTEKEDAFQRYAVDSISDLIAPILHVHSLALQRKNRSFSSSLQKKWKIESM